LKKEPKQKNKFLRARWRSLDPEEKAARAKLVDLTKQEVALYVYGHRPITPQRAINFAEVFNVPRSDMLPEIWDNE